MQRLRTPLGAETTLRYESGKGLLGGVLASKIPGNLSIPYPAAAYEWMGSRPLGRRVRPPEIIWDARSRTRWDGFGDLVEYDERASLLGGLLTSQVARFEYEYNSNGRLVAEQRTGGSVGESRSYDLDELDRVVGYQSDSQPSQRFFLDEVNNIRQTAWGSGLDLELAEDRTIDDGASDGLNAVTRIEYPAESMTRTLTHDAAGNTLTDSGAPGLPERAFSWDDHGRLVAVESGQAGEAGWKLGRYVYDAFDRRVGRYAHASPGAPDQSDFTEFHLYGSDVVEEVEDYFPPAKRDRAFVVFHDPTATDRYVMFQTYERVGGAWKYRYSTLPVTDRRNNVVALLRNGQAPASTRRTYDLHGFEESPDSGSYYMPYRFAGRQWDEESDLYYYRSRYYDPSLGRFISLDTIGIWGDLNNYGNGYAYVGNMGNSNLDPMGTDGPDDRANDSLKLFVDTTAFLLNAHATWTLGRSAGGVLLAAEAGASPYVAIVVSSAGVGLYNIVYVALPEIANQDRRFWENLLDKYQKDLQIVAGSKLSAEEKANRAAALQQAITSVFQQLCKADKCKKVDGKWVPDDGTGDNPEDDDEDEEDDDGDDDGDDREGENPNGMSAPDSNDVPNIRDLIKTGRLKATPKGKKKISEYPYEKLPLRAKIKWRRQRDKPHWDGRGPFFSWWRFQAPLVNWEGRMGILPKNRSGVIDPVR